MEIYDIVMLVVLVGAMLFGAVKGFAWQLASIASIVVSYAVAYHFREPFSESIQATPPWNRFLAMLILYVGTSLVIWVAFRMVSGSIDRLRLKEFDRQVGALFGLAKGGLYCTLITLFAVTLLGNTTRENIVESKSGNYIANVLARSESVIPPEIQEIVKPYLDRFEEKFHGAGSDENESVFEQMGTQIVQEKAGDFLPESFWNEPPGGMNGQTPFSSSPQQAQQPWNGSYQR
ncbi:CvpA family protein [Planctomycetes bacterium CA13]|uniref:CvpA family protein n=1 Tax=Novipirellula herctigrandis TaxID=2527986 RepID=UPI0011B8542A